MTLYFHNHTRPVQELLLQSSQQIIVLMEVWAIWDRRAKPALTASNLPEKDHNSKINFETLRIKSGFGWTKIQWSLDRKTDENESPSQILSRKPNLAVFQLQGQEKIWSRISASELIPDTPESGFPSIPNHHPTHDFLLFGSNFKTEIFFSSYQSSNVFLKVLTCPYAFRRIRIHFSTLGDLNSQAKVEIYSLSILGESEKKLNDWPKGWEDRSSLFFLALFNWSSMISDPYLSAKPELQKKWEKKSRKKEFSDFQHFCPIDQANAFEVLLGNSWNESDRRGGEKDICICAELFFQGRMIYFLKWNFWVWIVSCDFTAQDKPKLVIFWPDREVDARW